VCSINNTAAFNPRMTMLHLSNLRSLALVAAWNKKNDNPCIPYFSSVYELIE
ncbi:MAG: hypothetical protein GX942_02580, partial [Papillibacter sp.]|nr:hypothetical protein [Papillibacter sp.]